MSLLAILQWCEYSQLFVMMRASSWFFPVIASVHLFGLALMGGAVLVVDLRLLGLGLTQQPVARLARDAQRWMLVSLSIMVPTGMLMFLSTATKCYFLTAFWVKITALVLALAFTVTVRRRLTATTAGTARDGRATTVAIMSLSLWSAVAVCGRLIGFY